METRLTESQQKSTLQMTTRMVAASKHGTGMKTLMSLMKQGNSLEAARAIMQEMSQQIAVDARSSENANDDDVFACD